MTKQERIEQLERELAIEREKVRRNTIIDTVALPKCKSMACWGCKHIVVYSSPNSQVTTVLGCGKNQPCEDYEPTEQDGDEVRRLWNVTGSSGAGE